jgi:hypothetical protein
MSKDHNDALAITAGACNPSGIAHAIMEACREVRDENGTPTADAAVRLMAHQLPWICKAYKLDSDLTEYCKLTHDCPCEINSQSNNPTV